MKNKFLIMGLTLTLPLASLAFGPDNALEALTELKETAIENNSYNASVEGNAKAKEKYNQNLSQLRANIATQEQNISEYKKSQQAYADGIANMIGLKKAAAKRQETNRAQLAKLKNNLAAEVTKKQLIETAQSEIEALNSKNTKDISKKRAIKAKLTNLRNLQDSKGLNPQQAQDLHSLNSEMAEIRSTMDSNKADINAKKILITQTENDIKKLGNGMLSNFKVNALQARINSDKNYIKAYENQIESHGVKIQEIGKKQLEAQSAITSTGTKIDANLKSLRAVSSETGGIKLRAANSAAKNALGHLLMKGENSKFKAELMFQSANDVLNNLTSAGANREIMAEALKKQAERAIKKSVIGQYIEDQLKDSRKQSCEEVAQCMNLQQLGISQSSLIKATPGSQEAEPLPGKKPASLQETN